MSARTFCDRGLALARAGGRSAHPRLILAVTILASTLDYIDGSVVNVGLPAVGRDLHGDAAQLQWVVNAFLLPLSALLLFGGALGDRFGRRRLLTAGLGLFAAGSVACALAPSLSWLIAARAIQGLAAAMILPSSLAILGDSFQGAARSRAVGIWAATGSVGGALGPVLGGWLIDQVGWRAIFLINLPLAVGAIAIALYAIPAATRTASPARLDLAGAALATATIAGLTWGLTEGAGPGGWTAPAIAAIVAGCLFAAGFLWVERRQGERAMTPLALFGSRPIVALNLLTLLLYGAVAAFMLLLPYLLITVVGYSATAAGAALLPFPLIVGGLSPVFGDLAGRIGARPLLITGGLLVASGLLLGLRASGGAYAADVLPAVAVAAAGMGCAAAPLTSAVLSSVGPDHTGAASGLNSAVAQLGGVIAVALIGGVLAAKGGAFVDAFRIAIVASAGACVAAAAAIAVLFRPTSTGRAM